jgi:hypothetical protein
MKRGGRALALMIVAAINTLSASQHATAGRRDSRWHGPVPAYQSPAVPLLGK